jgi:hypothetical protein
MKEIFKSLYSKFISWYSIFWQSDPCIVKTLQMQVSPVVKRLHYHQNGKSERNTTTCHKFCSFVLCFSRVRIIQWILFISEWKILNSRSIKMATNQDVISLVRWTSPGITFSCKTCESLIWWCIPWLNSSYSADVKKIKRGNWKINCTKGQRTSWKGRNTLNNLTLWEEPLYLSSIALDYGLHDREFESRQGLEIFLFTTMSRPTLGPIQPPIQWIPRALCMGVKRPGR